MRRVLAIHPRSRGEHTSKGRCGAPPSGPSPLARGTHPDNWWDGTLTRFIPARAGNTSAPAAKWPAPTVHPRSRGEHILGDTDSEEPDGSSPLARGTHVHCRRGSEVRREPYTHPVVPIRASVPRGGCGPPDSRPPRFIPARAGNTGTGSPRRWPRPVHPRSRGEHSTSTLTSGRRLRFIPARAGNTAGRGRPLRDLHLHPRSRGEHRRCSAIHSATAGSSPLARGTPPPREAAHAVRRFIPARAGNTASGSRTPGRPAVHPRSRGEHSFIFAWKSVSAGSSPLARGTRKHADSLKPS